MVLEYVLIEALVGAGGLFGTECFSAASSASNLLTLPFVQELV